MHDHGYACSLMTNSLANISLNHVQLLSDTDALSAEIRSLNVQLDELKVEVETLRSSRFSLEKIKDDDKFYTGFPNYKAHLCNKWPVTFKALEVNSINCTCNLEFSPFYLCHGSIHKEVP